MSWAKVDDRLHAHIKATRAGEAMALWVLALSWSVAYLTDGLVSTGGRVDLRARGRSSATGSPAARMGQSGKCLHRAFRCELGHTGPLRDPLLPHTLNSSFLCDVAVRSVFCHPG